MCSEERAALVATTVARPVEAGTAEAPARDLIVMLGLN